MTFPQPPITWNQRLNAWDGATIEALRERIVRDTAVREDVVTLFVDTLQWSVEHPFLARDVEALLHCWTMLVPGSNVPWDQYTNADLAPHHFLALIASGNAPVMLECLNRHVPDRLNNKEESAVWIVQALEVAAHLDAKEVAPVLAKLSKTWLGNVHRNPDFVHEVGIQSIHMPWQKMSNIHTKFEGYPRIQEAIVQWNALCNAERFYQKGSSQANTLGMELFTNKPDSFHAAALGLAIAGKHLYWRWGPEETPVGVDKDLLPYRKLLNDLATRVLDGDDHGLDLGLLRQAAKWTWQGPDGKPEPFALDLYTAVLLGDKPYFEGMLRSTLNGQMQTGQQVSLDMLYATSYTDIDWNPEEKAWFEEGARAYLLNFAQSGGNGILTVQSFTSMLSFLSSDTIGSLRHCDNPFGQRLFWRCLEEPEALNETVRRQVRDTPVVQNAILATTLMESHGVEHWAIGKDNDHRWSRTLALWYPERMDAWENVWRETLRNPKQAPKILFETILQVQNIPLERWTVVQQLLDNSIEKTRDARLALAGSRIWNIGMPHVADQLSWVVEVLRSGKEPNVTLALPSLDESPLRP